MNSIDFDKFSLMEKMGVISYESVITDIYNISDITEDFLNILYKNPNKLHSKIYTLNSEPIKLNYFPFSNNKENGKAEKSIAHIYVYANKQNYFKLKYTIIHELIHILQYIQQFNYNFPVSKLTRIRNNLRKPYLVEYTDIVKYVLKKIYFNKQFLNKTINEIKTSNKIFEIIVNILVGHFSILGNKNSQNYFDKFVFELHPVKELQIDITNILNNNNITTEIVEKIFDTIEKYIPKLLKYKNVIIDSFIEHLKYWYEKNIKQYGKAIQLGIDDAINNNVIYDQECFKSLDNKRILLYPGGFKPFHDGHLLLLENVLQHNNELNIDKVYIITSDTNRDNITYKYIFPIISDCINYLNNKYPDITFEYKFTGNVSPIRYCYNLINESCDEIFAILSSNKSKEDKNRNNTLYNQYIVGGKYNKNKWDFDKVFEIPDEYINAYKTNDKVISATDLRQYIKDNTYNDFKFGYTYMLNNNIIDENILYKIFTKCK